MAKQSSFMERYEEWKRKQEQQETQQKAQQEEFTYTAPKGGTIADRYEAYQQQRQAYEQKQTMASGTRMANVQLNAFQRIQSKNQQGQAAEARKKAQEAALEEAAAQKKQQDHVDFINLLRQKYMPDATKPPQVEPRKYEPVVPQQEPAKPAEQKASDAALAAAEYDRRERDERDRSDREAREALLERLKKEGEGGALPDNAKAWASDAVSDAPAGAAEISAAEQITKWETDLERIRKMRDDELSAYGQTERWQSLSKTIDDVKKAIADKQKEVDSQQEEQIFGKPETAATGRGGELTEGAQAGPGIPMSKSWDRMREMAEGLKQPDAAQAQEPQEAKPELSLEELQANREQILADIARYDAAAKTNKVGMQDVEGQQNKANSAAMKAQAEKALEDVDQKIQAQQDAALVKELQEKYDVAPEAEKGMALAALKAAKYKSEWSQSSTGEKVAVWLGDRFKYASLLFGRGLSAVFLDIPTDLLGIERTQWSKDNQYLLNQVQRNINLQAERTSAATHIGGEILSASIRTLPSLAIAILTGGKSLQGEAVSIMNAAGQPMGTQILQATMDMLKNPSFVSSYLDSLGNNYTEEKDVKGNDTITSLVNANMKAVPDAMIEVGGGIETAASKPRGLATIRETAKEEGMEEFWQGIAGRAYDYSQSGKGADTALDDIVSWDNPEAIVSGKQMIEETAMGAAVGGLLGGVQQGVFSAVDSVLGSSQQGQEFNYGLALRDIITPQAAQAIQTVASTLPEGSTARQLAEKFDPKKSAGEMLRATLDAVGTENQQVLIDTVAQSVEERLRELGEKGDVSAVAQAVAAVYGGLEITPERRTALTSSQYGIDLLKIMQAKDAAQYRAEMEEAAEREQAALDQANDEAYAAILNEVEGADQIAIEPEQRGGFARAYELLRFGMSAEQAAKQSGLSAELAEQIKGLADQKWAQDLPGLLEKAAGVQAQMPEVGKGKISFDPGVDRDTWTKEQRDQVKAIAPFVQAMGYQVEVYQSVPDADGEFRAENGSYLREDGTYRLDINAGRQTQDVGSVLTALAMGHEVYHHLQNTVPDLARSYSGIVLDYLAEKMDVGAAIEAKMNRARANGRSINLNTAVEEVLADASEMMLNDTQAPRMLAEKNPRLFKRIKEWIANFAKRVREAFAGIEPSQKESKALTEQRNGILKYINDLNERFDSMLVEEATRRTAVQAERKAEAPKAEAPKAKSDKAAKKTAPLAQVTAKAGVVPAPVIQDGVVGSYGVTYTADNEEVGFYYAVVPQASVNASMTAEGVPNERFTGVQPRDTDRLNSKSFIDRVGGHELNYARVSDSAEVNGGAPVVDKDLVVQAGNHRKAAIEKALSKGGKTGSRYTADLKADAANKGIDPSKVVEGMMLVRVQVSGPDLTIKGNDPTTQRYSATELAEVDAQRLTPAMLDLADMMGGDINAKANARFVARFISEVVPKAEQGMMLDKNGRLSTEGERRIRNALFQYVYQDEALTASVAEATDPESRNILTAMTDIAPRMAMLNDDMQRGTLDKLPVSSEFAEAYRTVLRQKQSGRTVDEYLAQVKMQEETPVQRMLLQMMADHKRSAVKMGEALDSVLDELETRADRQQIDMLGEHTAPSVQAVVKAGLERFRGDLAASERFSEREQSTLDRKYLQAVEKGDTRAAQEMVDEAARAAGYDVDNIGKVYHGTAAQFNEFNPSKIADGSGHGRPGVLGQLGFYFTNDAEMASSYAYTPASKDRRVISAYIKTDNPLHISDEGWGSAISQADRRESELRRWASEGQHDSIIVESTDEILVDKDGKEFTDKVIVVFDPEQIKSADPITYDDQGKVIPLSERFNSENADIRFSMREPAPVFYSKMQQEIEAFKGDKMSAGSVIDYLRGKGVKAEEIRWSGVQTWLQGKKSVSKQELLDFVRGNEIEIRDVRRGAEEGWALWAWNDAVRLDVDEDEKTITVYSNDDEAAYIEYDENEDFYTDTLTGKQFSDWDEALEFAEDKAEEQREYWASDEAKSEYSTNKALYEQYKLDGGEEYREFEFTLPNHEGEFKSSHWDEKNVLAHTRLQDFTAEDGGTVLFVDEVQSDWHQAGREKGYEEDNSKKLLEARAVSDKAWEVNIQAEKNIRDTAKILAGKYGISGLDNKFLLDSIWINSKNSEEFKDEFKKIYGEQIEDSDIEKIAKRYAESEIATEEYVEASAAYEAELKNKGIPDAPYKTTWHEYVLKRVLRMAAEGDYDYVGWTTGQMQADRYNLANYVDTISAYKDDWGTYDVVTYNKDKVKVLQASGVFKQEELVSIFGKEVATKIINGTESGKNFHLRDQDLSVGGEGMKAFYDIGGKSSQNIPKFLNKYGAQWGAGVQEIGIKGTNGESYQVPAIQVNEKMKQSVLYEGQARFSERDSDNRKLTAEQVEFFKDSKIRDEQGRLKVVYHHSGSEFTTFDRSYARTSMEMDGFFFAPENDPYNEYGKNVITAYLNIKNPIYNPRWEYGQTDAGKKERLRLAAEGYDGVIWTEEGEIIEYMAFNPEQIKSISNKRPTTNEDIRFSERQRDLLSKRDILAGAFDQVAKTETEKQKLNNYKRMVRQLNRLEAEAADLRQQNTAERRKKSGADKALIAERSKQIAEIEERIDSADRRLIRLQNAAPLRNVLKREIAQRVKEAKAEYRGAAAERRAKTADRYDARISELKTKHADYRAHVSDKKLRDGYVGRIEKTAAELNTWLQAPDKKKYVNEGMRKTVSSLLESLDMSSFTKEGEARASKRAKSWQESMSALSAQMNAMDMRFGESEAVMVVDPDLAVDIQNLISENDGEVSYRNLSTEDLEKMESIIRRVKKAVTTVNTMHTMGRNTQVEDVAMGTISYAEGQREKKLRGSVAERLSTMMSLDMSDAFTYFESLGPDAQKVLHSLYNKGFGRLVENTKTAQEFFERLNNKYKGMATWSGKKATVQTFDVEGGKLHLTPGNIMELYLLNQREQARGHIYGKGLRVETEAGRGRKGMYQIDPVTVTTEDVNRILSTLTEDQTRAAKEISDFLNSTMSDWGNEVSMELYGYNKLIEQSYYPIRSDTNATLTKDPDANFSMNALLNLGMMKALNKNANNAIYVGDIFGTIAKHITDMANYNAFAAPLVDAMKWFNFKTPYEVNGRMTTRNVKGSIERLHGTAGKAYFVNLLKAVNGIRTPTVATGFSGLINSLVGKMKVSAVAGNARVIMQQHASYSRASAMMNPLDMAQAYLRSPKRGMEMAQKYSPIAAWKHMGYFDMNIGRQMDALITGKESAFNKVQEAMLKPAGFMDDFTLGVLWNAAEIELGRTYAGDKRSEAFYRKVGERVTEVVDRTQVVDTVFHRSQVMRDKDGLIKITTNFMAEPIKTYNLLMSAIRSKDIKKIARVGTSTLASWIVTAAAAGMIDALRDKDKDKGWAGYWESYLRSTFGLGGDFWESNLWDNANPANMIPFAKDVYGLATGFSPSRPDLQAAQRIVWAGNDWLKLFNGEYKKTPYDLIYSTAAAISTVTGMPINNVMRDTVSTIDTLNPAMVGIAGGPSAKAVYKRYAEAADAGDAEAALDYYNKLLEMGQSEKDIDTGYWNAQEGKKYDEWASSIVSGTDLKKTMQRYLDHGVTAQTLGGQITKMFKPEYVALVKSGKKAEAAKLKGYLLNAYVVIGYKREDKNKDIDAWLKEK